MTRPVAWKGAVAGPQRNICENALFPHGVKVSEDTVRMGRLVKQGDVHGARAGAGFTILMNCHGHGSFTGNHFKE